MNDSAVAEALCRRIARVAQGLGTVRIMEVCGSHTMAAARGGLRSLLPDTVRLISGPGCPVCVTVTGYIDTAITLAQQGVIIATFGDLMRVPGSRATLSHARAAGGEVQVCYSPDDALTIARRTPQREVVFLAVGFETTTAPIAGLLDQIIGQGVTNLSLLMAFKRVIPALHALLLDDDAQVNAFLCPGHVSAIIGADVYQPIVDHYGVPCIIAGFEPLDILQAIDRILDQLVRQTPALENLYRRVVTPQGNQRAQGLIERYLQPVDAAWRGIGSIPASGYGLKPAFRSYDATVRHQVTIDEGQPHPQCRCGEVLKGCIQPAECALFGTVCLPESPFGPCMVSNEGSCAASYKYGLPL